MVFRTLIDTETVFAHLGDPSLAIVDCRSKLDDPEWAPQQYESSHIPGAVPAHLDRDMSGPKTGANGRHPLPDPAAFADTLSRLGIDAGVQVVAYDQDSAMYASRFWWMVRWLGHDRVAVLDGGFAKWVAQGRPTKAGREHRARRSFVAAPDWRAVAHAEEIGALPPAPAARLLDARAPERFSGASEPIDRIGGHIPGATSYFYGNNVDERGVFRPPDVLRPQLEAALGGTAPDRVICYCGSGVTACQNLLALEHVGLSGSRLYVGSWSEWSSDPARPVATGLEGNPEGETKG
jgi:thiosulfate/3-mercaptopyruvate sulfurtransferase